MSGQDHDFDSSTRMPQDFATAESAELASHSPASVQRDAADHISPASVGSIRGRGNAPVRTAMLQRMQQSYGNRAIQRFLSVQRSSASPAADQEEDVAGKIQSRAGGGSSLDDGTKARLEDGLGADMSGVRVHTDGEADSLARSVDATAFTTGNDIFFRQGSYDPGSERGLHLLAHEATHTVQQSQGPVSGTPMAGGVSVSDPSDQFEQAAERSAQNVVTGQPAEEGPVPGSPAPIQRQVPEEEEMPAQTMRPSTYGAIVQREAAPEEEEMPAQAMRPSTYSTMVQREGAPEEEELPAQTMRAGLSVQRHADADEDEG